MRLFKKAAVCLLAAAMAVSMLTACGDDGPSNPGNGGNGGSTGGGNTSTSTPAKPETPDSKDENNSVIPEEPEKVTWATSLTKKYFQGISSDNFCMVGSLIEDATGAKPFAYATQGKKQIMVKQSKDPQKNEIFYAVCYLNESGDLYVTTSQKLPTKLSDLTDWKKAKDMGATEKQIMVKQSKDPQKNEIFYAVCYLNESGDLYVTTSQKLPTKLSDLTDWKKAKDMGATEKQIEEIKNEMDTCKQGTCISDKVLPETFVSQTANGTYVETMKAKIENATYDYAFAFLPNGNMLRVAIGSGNNIFYIFQPASGTRVKACPAETFPNF